MPTFQWKTASKNRKYEPTALHLFAGSNTAIIATLTKATKHWEAWVWLPDCKQYKRYGPLEVQKSAIMQVVESWYEEALRPGSDFIKPD